MKRRVCLGCFAILLTGATAGSAIASDANPAASPSTAANVWVATGLDDQYVIRVLDDSHIEGTGPYLADHAPGKQTLRHGGTIVWEIGGSTFTGKAKGDELVMDLNGVTHPRKVVFTRADEETVRGILTRLQLINLGIRSKFLHRVHEGRPVPINIVVPKYPPTLRSGGIAGSVTVRLELNDIGVVVAAHVVESSRPEFEAPALAAIGQTVYRAAVHGGFFVPMEVMRKVDFPADGTAPSMDDPLPMEAMPEATVHVPPTYPLELRPKGGRGSATIEFVVELDGSVSDAHVIKATRPAFGLAAVEAITQWKFLAGIKEWHPVRTKMTQEIEFSVTADPKD